MNSAVEVQQTRNGNRYDPECEYLWWRFEDQPPKPGKLVLIFRPLVGEPEIAYWSDADFTAEFGTWHYRDGRKIEMQDRCDVHHWALLPRNPPPNVIDYEALREKFRKRRLNNLSAALRKADEAAQDVMQHTKKRKGGRPRTAIA